MKTFLITGASSGIGEATARMAVEAGYRVVLAARTLKKLEVLVEELGGSETALAVKCDVTSYADQQNMVAESLKVFGRIDVAFANAGIGTSQGGTERGDPENWRDMILTNVLGCALTAKVCLPQIRKNEGHILLMGSNAGRRPLRGSIYGATKWAVTGFGYNLQEEVAGTGARVTLLEPGMVDTPFFDEPKPKVLHAEDVARAVMYAVSQPPHVDISELRILPNVKKSD